MDPVGALIHRVGKLSPALAADLYWWRSRRSDFSLRVIDALVRPDTTVVDIGASWGLFTRRMARRVGRGGRVHAFEPNPVNLQRLERIYKSHGQVVTVHRAAVSDRGGQAPLLVPRIGGVAVHDMGTLAAPGHLESGSGPDLRVPVVRLDDVITADHRPVSFIKCDVEGHELSVLRGAARTLESHPQLLIEVEQRHHNTPLDQVLDDLRNLGEVYAVFPSGLRPLSDFNVERDQLAHLRAKTSPTEGEPPEYVKDFLVLSEGTPPEKLVDRRITDRAL